jgi:hypothetical protein
VRDLELPAGIFPERAYAAQVVGDSMTGDHIEDGDYSVECSFVAVHRIRVTWESSQVRTTFGR